MPINRTRTLLEITTQNRKNEAPAAEVRDTTGREAARRGEVKGKRNRRKGRQKQEDTQREARKRMERARKGASHANVSFLILSSSFYIYINLSVCRRPGSPARHLPAVFPSAIRRAKETGRADADGPNVGRR